MLSLVYILACSHSGSTLLAMLLGAHPDLGTVGELKLTSLGNPDRYRCSCGQSIRQCPFWLRVAQAMSARGIPFDIGEAGTSITATRHAYLRLLLRPLIRGPVLEAVRDAGLALSPAWRKHFVATQERNQALIEVLRQLTGARIIVDSSKTGLRLKYLLRNPALDVRVLRLIRDGRAVALSGLDTPNFADAADPRLRFGGFGERRGRTRYSLAQAAQVWRRSNEEAEHLLQGLDPARWLQVRYEHLCRDPVEELARICRFLDLDAAKLRLDFRAAEQHVVGNGMRLDSTSQISLDERWRRHLAARDLRLFDRIAGDLNRAYGYS
jgi:hypothetical protein